MPDPRKMKAAAARARAREQKVTYDTPETQFETQASKARKMKYEQAQRGKYANPSSRSLAEKAVDHIKFAARKPKTFSQFYIWGGDSVWNADKGRRSPNMIGGMERAERQQTKRQEKRQFNRTMKKQYPYGSQLRMTTNKIGMSNTPETTFEAAPPPLSRLGKSGITKRGGGTDYNQGKEKGWRYR